MQGIPRTDYAYCIGYPGLAMHRKPRTGYAGDAQGWLCRGYPGPAMQEIPRAGCAGDTKC